MPNREGKKIPPAAAKPPRVSQYRSFICSYFHMLSKNFIPGAERGTNHAKPRGVCRILMFVRNPIYDRYPQPLYPPPIMRGDTPYVSQYRRVIGTSGRRGSCPLNHLSHRHARLGNGDGDNYFMDNINSSYLCAILFV